ncbi:glutathione S-transferase 1-1-like [Styela clava]|uniref:glutathione S-transferase 1-like n=1 Tax=Styela clava TaxID=7725 RepID=UPI00193A3082|nr:glutathione S-transferase 1-like [Styela clava]
MSCNVDFYYFTVSPPSRAVWMTLEELGIKYNEHIVDISKGEHKTADYKKISFRQKVPAIKDGDLCLAESRAIAAYLVSEYGAQQKKQYLYPQESKLRAKIDQHLYIGENIFDQIQAYVNVGGVLFRGEKTRLEKVDEAKAALGSIEFMLEDHAYTAGDKLTIADFFYYIAIQLLSLTDFDEFDKFPKVVEWKKKMQSLPYHKKTCDEPMTKFRQYYQHVLSSKKE